MSIVVNSEIFVGNMVEVAGQIVDSDGAAVDLTGAINLHVRVVDPKGDATDVAANLEGTDTIKCTHIVTSPGRWLFFPYAENVGAIGWKGHIGPVEVSVRRIALPA